MSLNSQEEKVSVPSLNGIESNCDNISDNNPSITKKSSSLAIPKRVVKDEAKMRESILKALKEYEEEEESKEASAKTSESKNCSQNAKSVSFKISNMEAETSSPDIVPLKLTCNRTD